MSKRYFGALNYRETKEIVDKICAVIGNGSNGCRSHLMLEVIYWKTGNGRFHPQKSERYGIAQLSPDSLRIIKENRCNNEKVAKCTRLLSRFFYVDLVETKAVEIEDNPMLSLCFLALISVNIRELIPMFRFDDNTQTGRAKFAVDYGSSTGSGTMIRDYIDKCKLLDEDASKENDK